MRSGSRNLVWICWWDTRTHQSCCWRSQWVWDRANNTSTDQYYLIVINSNALCGLKMIHSVIHSHMVRSETSAVTDMKGCSSTQTFRRLFWVRFVRWCLQSSHISKASWCELLYVFIYVCECLSWCDCCRVCWCLSEDELRRRSEQMEVPVGLLAVRVLSGNIRDLITHTDTNAHCVLLNAEQRVCCVKHSLIQLTRLRFWWIYSYIKCVCVFIIIRLMCVR